ncbi:MAG: MerR family transcriptional regulator [Spirochaetes bacterium]|nr:MerR family transcriptional regulator [Spirochaetota bacterium]
MLDSANGPYSQGEFDIAKYSKYIYVVSDFLTISQLAMLFNISTHQIRYFEEKGLLEPPRQSGNAYRQYGEQEIYCLASILLFREMGIPVAEILKISQSNDRAFLESVLQKQRNRITNHIRDQLALRDILDCHLQLAKQKDTTADFIESMPERALRVCISQHWRDKIQVIDYLKLAPLAVTEDVFRLYYDETEKICLSCLPEQAGIILPAGTYNSHIILVDPETTVDTAIEEFMERAISQFPQLSAPLILIEDSARSLLAGDKLLYKMQIKIS